MALIDMRALKSIEDDLMTRAEALTDKVEKSVLALADRFGSLSDLPGALRDHAAALREHSKALGGKDEVEP